MRGCGKCLLTVVVLVNLFSCSRNVFYYETSFPEGSNRNWIGPSFWSNRLQDWRLHEGRIECIGGSLPIRTVHVLTRSLGQGTGDLKMSVRTGEVSGGAKLSSRSWSGFLIGVGGAELDYRARAIIHLGSGRNGGLVAGIDGEGRIVFLDNEKDLKPLEPFSREGKLIERSAGEDIELKLYLYPEGDNYSISLEAHDFTSGELLQQATLGGVKPSQVCGNLALVTNGGADELGVSSWFRDWQIFGSKVEVADDRSFGPIIAALHTVSRRVMKMTVQLAPLAETDPQVVRLQISKPGGEVWNTIAEAPIVVPGWTAHFRVPDWNSGETSRYRVVYEMPSRGGETSEFHYEGTIRKDPVDREELVVAAFTGNSNTFGSFEERYTFTDSRLWFPHAELVEHVVSRKPDFLVFTGDQVYEGRPTSPDRSGNESSFLDYLYKWYLWCWAYRDLARDLPAVCLPDDHDVYHGNVWGAGGHPPRENPPDGKYPDYYKGFEAHWRQDGGGYLMPPGFVNMVQRTQTGHLPDPVDPAPVDQGIGVYFTDLNYGGVSFAVIEDRKFKSAPSVAVPAAKVVNGFTQVPGFDMQKADVPGAELLGQRQLKFLEQWAADWEGAWMKVALSQTIFAAVSTYPKEFQTDAGTPELKALPADVVPEGYDLSRDMDTNGWPQTGRNKALHELRRGYAFMIAGDQHLGSIVHHGIEEWDDAGYSFSVPSVANLWPRRWYPPSPGKDRQNGMPAYTGKFRDGFGNHMTVWAVSNPVISGHEPSNLHDRAPGYGIVRLNKTDQSITMECWPRYAKPGDPNSDQYPGWPLTISMEDNYGRKASGYLPTLEFSGMEDPVVQVVDELNGEVVYTIRAKGLSFRPKIFKRGFYEIRVGEPGTDRIRSFTNIESLGLSEEPQSLTVQF